ncbi:MAG: hypothetical protein K6T16_01605 [Candidatus Pacearchaeota archaeon]|nr:hypothetical protein [Candidatus Pacearchaeota archaeon]
MADKIKPQVKLAMVMAVNEVLEYKEKRPYSSTEEILQHVMKNIKAKGEAKIGAIASASLALNYKEKNPEAKDKEIMQLVMNQSSEIIDSISKNK